MFRPGNRPFLLLVPLLLGACGDPSLAPVPAKALCPVARSGQTDSGVVRVATLNIWAIPWISDDLFRRVRRMGPALKALKPDVVCIQEAFSASGLATLKGGIGADYLATRGAPGGLVILSRFPVREQSFAPFPVFPGLSVPEKIAGKGILEAVLETPAGALRVVTVHLALAFGPDNPRSRQLRFLLDHVDRRRDLPTVLAGDLNTTPVRAGQLTNDYRAILDRGWVATDPPRGLPGGAYVSPTPTRIGWPRPRETTIGWSPDHILLRDGPGTGLALVGFAVALADRKTAVSDHNLLVADLLLTDIRLGEK